MQHLYTAETKQIFEKYFLLSVKKGRPCPCSSVNSSRLQMFTKNVFLKISPISQENTPVLEFLFNKVVGLL